MKASVLKGICFGLTSGIITTLGLIVGLSSFIGSRLAVIGGILTIAVADSFSDALGIHLSEESEGKSERQIWFATGATFLSKMLFSCTFLLPVILFPMEQAIPISIAWGLSLLALISYFMAKEHKNNPLKVIGEHLFIALLVIFLTHQIGDIINMIFI